MAALSISTKIAAGMIVRLKGATVGAELGHVQGHAASSATWNGD